MRDIMRGNNKDNKTKWNYNKKMKSYYRPHQLFILDASQKDARITLRLSLNQWNDIKSHCEKLGIQQNQFIRFSIISKLESSNPYSFKKTAYKYADEVLENPRSITINNELKNIIYNLLSKTEWDLQSFARLAIAERLTLRDRIF